MYEIALERYEPLKKDYFSHKFLQDDVIFQQTFPLLLLLLLLLLVLFRTTPHDCSKKRKIHLCRINFFRRVKTGSIHCFLIIV